jgi:CheY-like chemotaxis protein
MAKILVVDDEPLIVEMLSSYLTLMGHEPIGALSGRQTWDKLAYEEPDMILLDIQLPDENGLDICRKLRQQDATRHVPIVIISAHFPPRTQEANQAGANGYLAKPINMNALKSAISGAGVA